MHSAQHNSSSVIRLLGVALQEERTVRLKRRWQTAPSGALRLQRKWTTSHKAVTAPATMSIAHLIAALAEGFTLNMVIVMRCLELH
jgi:hypothetical protein